VLPPPSSLFPTHLQLLLLPSWVSSNSLSEHGLEEEEEETEEEAECWNMSGAQMK
jgi:hypothetical protein